MVQSSTSRFEWCSLVFRVLVVWPWPLGWPVWWANSRVERPWACRRCREPDRLSRSGRRHCRIWPRSVWAFWTLRAGPDALRLVFPACEGICTNRAVESPSRIVYSSPWMCPVSTVDNVNTRPPPRPCARPAGCVERSVSRTGWFLSGMQCALWSWAPVEKEAPFDLNLLCPCRFSFRTGSRSSMDTLDLHYGHSDIALFNYITLFVFKTFIFLLVSTSCNKINVKFY